jgi:1,4-alpha-glucan branching enzyme
MLGARFDDNGTRFRVWAPNADQAFVAYNNHWTQQTAFELTRNGEFFEGFSTGMAVGTRYKFIFVEHGGRFGGSIPPRATPPIPA